MGHFSNIRKEKKINNIKVSFTDLGFADELMTFLIVSIRTEMGERLDIITTLSSATQSARRKGSVG